MPTSEITFLDRLSRLGFRRAAKLLGEEGEKLIRQGGQYDLGDLAESVQLSNDGMQVRVNAAVASITPDPERPKKLRLSCSRCRLPCEHLGAAMALLLEEKTLLGLAKAPDLEPVASLSEAEAAERALQERQERSTSEQMRVRAADAKTPWTDYAVTNLASGKSYRVALRSWAHQDNYCSCPDFRVNTLGTCKHILHVQQKMWSRFPKRVREAPYRRQGFAIAMRYGETEELWLLPPADLDTASKRVLRRLHDAPITDIHALLRVVPKLEARGHQVRFHADAEDYIQRCLHQERLARLVAEIRRDPASHPLRTKLLATELLPYQLDGIAFAAGAGRAILADDMGLGKTIQGIGVAELLAQQADVSRVLVICPTSLKGQWRSEIERFSGRSCSLVLGGMNERPAQYQADDFFIIANYEQVLRDHHAIGHAHWDLIILDEGQRIKNWEAKTSRVIKSLRSRFALVLSGTPLENRLDDLYSVAQFIDDRHLGADFRFFNRHRVVNERGRVLGYQHMDEIRERLKPFLLRRTRAALLKQLPPRSTEVVRILPTAEQKELHDAQKRIIASIIGKAYISEMDMLRLQRALLQSRMAADSTYLCDHLEPGHSSKLERLRELLTDLAAEPERKIIIFSEWTTMLDLIEPLLAEAGLEHVRLDGSVPQKKRQGLVAQFQNNDNCHVFLTTNAGSTGLNLQAADTVINVDLPWNPAVLEQRIGRAHRMGQKRPVQVYLLVTEQTIEEGMLDTLASKADLALAALDPNSEVAEVTVQSSVEEMKRKMEILLGKAEAAAEDEEQRRQTEAALQRKRKLEQAGGKLLGSAFEFLAQALPTDNSSQQDSPLAQYLASSLRACTEQGEDGRLRLSVDLGDGAALEALAGSIASIMAAQ
ncbi:MAG: DEAD/DEAH box helicase, partial [Planctomycetota bacterium]